MKHALFVIVSLSLTLLSGCSAPDIPEETVSITFSLSAYQNRSFSKNTRSQTSSLAASCKRLSFYVLKNGEIVTSEDRTSTLPFYDQVNVELPYGSYEIIFVGYNDTENMTFHPKDLEASFSKITDTFIYYKQINVSPKSGNEQQVILKRCVAKFELKANDKIPSSVKYAILAAEGGGTSVNLKTGKTAKTSIQQKRIEIPESVLGTRGNTFSLYAFLPETESVLNIFFTAFDNKNEPIANHSFASVPMRKNSITRYTGDTFGDTLSAQESIRVESQWLYVDEHAF